MKMKKYIGAFMIALTAVALTACNKKVDVVAVSQTLPGIQISSVGMFTAGPYVLPTGTATNTIQIIYGATTTSKAPGTIDVTLYDASVLGPAPAKAPNLTPFQTFHFNAWTGNDNGTPSYASVNYATVPTDYPNTTIYQGSIILKMGAAGTAYPATGGGGVITSGKVYNIKVVLTAADGTTSSYTQNNIFAIQ